MIKCNRVSRKEIVNYLIEKLTKNRVRLESVNIDYPAYKPESFGRARCMEEAIIDDEVWTITFRSHKRTRKNA